MVPGPQLANVHYARGQFGEAQGYFRAAVDGLLRHGRAPDDDAILEMGLKLAECLRHLPGVEPAVVDEGLRWSGGLEGGQSGVARAHGKLGWDRRVVEQSGRKAHAAAAPAANHVALHGLALSLLGRHLLATGRPVVRPHAGVGRGLLSTPLVHRRPARPWSPVWRRPSG